MEGIIYKKESILAGNTNFKGYKDKCHVNNAMKAKATFQKSYSVATG